jgi:hypothetical protein
MALTQTILSLSVPNSLVPPSAAVETEKRAEVIFDEVSRQGSCSVRKKRCIRVRPEKVSMVIGQDVKLKDITRGLGKALVESFHGKLVRVDTLKQWL